MLIDLFLNTLRHFIIPHGFTAIVITSHQLHLRKYSSQIQSKAKSLHLICPLS